MRAYVSHPIRGAKGKDATDAYMKANNQKAANFARRLREELPSLDLYVPAEHDEFVIAAYRKGILNEKQILEVDVEIVCACDFLIAYVPDGHVSRGMRVEINAAVACGMCVIFQFGAGDFGNIHRVLEDTKR